MIRSFIRTICPIVLVALGTSACDDSTGAGTTAMVDILLTDAPADYIAEATVDIGAVELLGGEGGPVVLAEDGTDGPVDLLDLQNATTELLASLEIEAGTYSQLRLIVESASVTLAPGYEFNSGGNTMELSVPSGAQTGIKLNLAAGEEDVEEGGVTISGDVVLVVDFDVNQSFRIQGNPDTPAGIESVSFQPTLRVVVNDVAGSISGTVSTSLAEVSVEGLVVSATPVDGTTLEPFQSTTATAMTAADGTYTIHFLVPGDYEVSVDAGDGLTADMSTITVGTSEDVADVDFVIVEG